MAQRSRIPRTNHQLSDTRWRICACLYNSIVIAKEFGRLAPAGTPHRPADYLLTLSTGLDPFYRHISPSSTKLLECQRAQLVKMSNPRTEIYNFRNRYQAAILVARYQSLAKDRFWPKPAINQISVNGRLRCQAAVEVPPKRAQMPIQSKLGMALFATARMYLAKVTSDLCPVCSRICHGCSPLIAACVQ